MATDEVAKLNNQVDSLKESVNSKKDTTESNNGEETVEGLKYIGESQIYSTIKKLKEEGYKEVEIKSELNKLNSSMNPNYKYSIIWNFDRVVNITDTGEMYINGNDTGYKFKMSIGDEYWRMFITEDNYLYNPDNMKIVVNSKIRCILENNDSINYIKVFFEDGNICEFTED